MSQIWNFNLNEFEIELTCLSLFVLFMEPSRMGPSKIGFLLNLKNPQNVLKRANKGFIQHLLNNFGSLENHCTG